MSRIPVLRCVKGVLAVAKRPPYSSIAMSIRDSSTSETRLLQACVARLRTAGASRIAFDRVTLSNGPVPASAVLDNLSSTHGACLKLQRVRQSLHRC